MEGGDNVDRKGVMFCVDAGWMVDSNEDGGSISI